MGQDEGSTMQALTAHREVMDQLIAQHRGRIANTAGDSVLAEFPSVVDAVKCAVEVQEKLREKNEGAPEDRQLRFRIGVHVGDVMVRGGDLFGDGVNIAARLQGIAEPGGVCISGEAHQYARRALSLDFVDLGQQAVKNVEDGVRAYALKAANDPIAVGSRAQKPLPLPDKPSIAVLPFANMSGDPEQEYFADGVVLFRDRTQFELHLQGQERRRAPSRTRAWRPIRA
jgi:adenylate cyclase